MERVLAHVETIIDLNPIAGADAIEVATILGWEVVVKKGIHNVGEKVIYCEIDSWIPTAVAPFLQRGTVRSYKGVEGERLKTIRLRGQMSQGLILPLTEDHEEGTDLTEALGIIKWEPPEQYANLNSGMRRASNFPELMRKTDQPRIQNEFYRIQRMIEQGLIKDEWVVQEKLEGSSMQVAKVNGVMHVTSRNVDLVLEQEGSHFIDTARGTRMFDLIENVETEYPVFALQGELIGPGIQGNIYKLDKYEYRIFDVWVGTRYLSVKEIIEFKVKAETLGYALNMVPIQPGVVTGLFAEGRTVKDILNMAQIKSSLNKTQDAEGLVFKNLTRPDVTFKAISDIYLLKQK